MSSFTKMLLLYKIRKFHIEARFNLSWPIIPVYYENMFIYILAQLGCNFDVRLLHWL
jgi:hypothetical protein